jgi:rhodanese-related sulfurtransferase
LLVALAAVGCGGEDAGGSAQRTPAEMVVPAATSAPERGASLDAQEFAAAAKRPGTVLLDVRTPEEFAAGHLPGAVNIDLAASDFRSRVESLDRSTPYGVYCRTGRRSAEAMGIMLAAGFERVFHLADGYVAWTDAGGEVVTD